MLKRKKALQQSTAIIRATTRAGYCRDEDGERISRPDLRSTAGVLVRSRAGGKKHAG
jgi:hypothetical protein